METGLAGSRTEHGERLAEVERRTAWVRERMEAASAGGVALASRRNFAWLTVGGLNHVVVASDTGAVPLLITASEVVALAPTNEAARVRDEELAGLPVEVVELPWHRADGADDEAARRAGGRVLHDADLDADLVTRRAMLAPLERERLRGLATELDELVAPLMASVEPGMVESELAAAASAALIARGIRAPVLLAAADERIEAYRHPLPTLRPVRERMMLVVVGEREGLHAAVTRIAELTEPSDDLRVRTQATGQVLDAMIAATQAGTTLGEVIERARAAYEAAGFPDELDLHHQGGTIGYSPRERIATPGDTTPLEPGMAVAWNPSVTGTKAEATLLVTDGVPERLPG